jgi:hypothetical protein
VQIRKEHGKISRKTNFQTIRKKIRKNITKIKNPIFCQKPIFLFRFDFWDQIFAQKIRFFHCSLFNLPFFRKNSTFKTFKVFCFIEIYKTYVNLLKFCLKMLLKNRIKNRQNKKSRKCFFILCVKCKLIHILQGRVGDIYICRVENFFCVFLYVTAYMYTLNTKNAKKIGVLPFFELLSGIFRKVDFWTFSQIFQKL